MPNHIENTKQKATYKEGRFKVADTLKLNLFQFYGLVAIIVIVIVISTFKHLKK